MTQSKGGQGRGGGGGELDDNAGGKGWKTNAADPAMRANLARALKQAEQEAQSNCRCYVVYILVRKEFS
jgi:hypothetical protein